MHAGTNRTVSICPVDFPIGFESHCKKCGALLRGGKFAIGVIDGECRYFVCDDEPVICCKEEHCVPLLYDDEGSREEARQQVLQTARHDHCFDFIPLTKVGREDCSIAN